MNWEDQEQDIGKSRHAFKEMLTDRSIYDNTQHYFPYIVKREGEFHPSVSRDETSYPVEETKSAQVPHEWSLSETG